MRYTSIYYNPSLYSNYLAHNESGTQGPPKNPRGGKYLYITDTGRYVYEEPKSKRKRPNYKTAVTAPTSGYVSSGKQALAKRGLNPTPADPLRNPSNKSQPTETQVNQNQTEEPAVTQAPEPWWKQTLNSIKSWGEKAWSDISGTVVSAVQAVGKGFNTAKTWVTNAIGSVGRFATNAYNSVLGAARRIGATFEDFARGVREGYQRVDGEGGRAYNMGRGIGGIGRGITDAGEFTGGFVQSSFGVPIDMQQDPNSPYAYGHSAGSVVNKLVVEPTAKLLNFGNQKLVQPIVNKAASIYHQQQADYVKNSSFVQTALKANAISQDEANGFYNKVASGELQPHQVFEIINARLNPN